MKSHRRSPGRTLRFALLLATLTLPAAAADKPRTVILGFDGADARMTEQWMDEGKLPNLARLRDQGTFSPLRSTVPSQTPVSWSTFSTGLSPGRHSIFDFLKRDTATYRPSFAAFDETKTTFLYGERNGLVFGLGAGVAVLLVLFLLFKLFRVGTGKALAISALLAAGAGAVSVGSPPTGCRPRCPRSTTGARGTRSGSSWERPASACASCACR